MKNIILFTCCLCCLLSAVAEANAPDHIVISEVEIGGVTSKDEFVELFNPTGSAVLVDGWKLTKRTSSGTESNLLSSTAFPDVAIPGYSYFLIAHPDYQGTTTPDALYSATTNSVAADNAVLLYDAEGTIVDLVGMGDVVDFETTPTIVPEDGKSITRRDVLLDIGVDAPAQDTDDNSLDFVLQDTPTPQSSADGSLPVTLSAFSAKREGNAVKLHWTTQTEVGNIGWHVYRGNSSEGPFVRLTQSLIPGAGDAAHPHQYSFVDSRPEAGASYYYLEDWDIAGTSRRSRLSFVPPIYPNRLSLVWATLKRTP